MLLRKSFNFITVSLALLALLAGVNPAQASNRDAHRFGIHAGLLGDPFPTLLGYNVNYNLGSFMRATAGYGSISATSSDGSSASLTTMGGGLRFFVPSYNFSPVVGLSYAKVSLTGTIAEGISGFSANASHMYATAGFDWQAANGFNLGFGVNYSLKAGVGTAPYFNFGWYF
jgi:hypothetical protein